MYQVIWSKGNGTHIGPRFRALTDALRYVEQHGDEASFAIRTPQGGFYRDHLGRGIRTRAA